MSEGHIEEQFQDLRRILLLTVYKNTLNQLVLQQRSQRLNARKPLSLPASLRRRRSSSMGEQEKPERILITGKVLPRLESLLGEPENDADLLDEDVLNALKFERDMDALRAIFEVAMNDPELAEKNVIEGEELETVEQETKKETVLSQEQSVWQSEDMDKLREGKDNISQDYDDMAIMNLQINKVQFTFEDEKVLDTKPSCQREQHMSEEGKDSHVLENKDEDRNDVGLENLKQAIAALGGNKSEESQAAQQLQESKDELKKLKENLETEKRDTKDKLQDLEERIAETKYKLRCVSRVNDLEYSLVQRWEEGRLAQGTIWGENAERAYLRDILDIKQKLAREERVSAELRAFRQREILELQARIKEWQERYVSEIRRVDREAESWELRILEQKKLLQRHREIYEERMTYVQEYRAQKEEEQRLLDLQIHRIECAVRLQAWWRGTMVRRGLGPFKKKPKRGKRGKPKK
ncbi:LOW QUALITY PROTEIN: dynein regulatory complex protein 9 [Drosophila gunungcola]|uniref:LOW QUALITY PROTEIN: dynein regulatory complex protein 9 n=1 Tax=Drosophila gunungcola TaxID=103775 RepID=UPI0022E3B5BC|nr:LOW QUALITY PROTEIN: dynein regulatory complex protein 9 [Drosophila gunungcola]